MKKKKNVWTVYLTMFADKLYIYNTVSDFAVNYARNFKNAGGKLDRNRRYPHSGNFKGRARSWFSSRFN